MSTDLVAVPDQTSILLPADPDKDTKYRLRKFRDWLKANGRQWYTPDLASYRDHMLDSGLAPSTVQAHLSTIRGRYRSIARERDLFYALVVWQTDNPLERKALVDEMVTRIRDAMDPQAAPVKIKVSQDRPDREHLRLTAAQASALMAAPGVGTLVALRDTAVIALMLCTGVREAELSALDVPDLRQRLGGELALHVREGKGCKERLVPYGDLEWVLAIIDRWMSATVVGHGAVFRSFFRGGKRLRGRLSVRAIQYLVTGYPIMVNGALTTVRPHDLRRTYARRLYEAGVDLVAIQQNLGHASQQTTLNYIGALDAAKRRPPAIYEFNLSKLNGAPVAMHLPNGSAPRLLTQ